jgi:hypothetical protein
MLVDPIFYTIPHFAQPVIINRVLPAWAGPLVWIIYVLQFPTEHLPLTFGFLDTLGPLLNLAVLMVYVSFFYLCYKTSDNKADALIIGPGLFFGSVILFKVLAIGDIKATAEEEAAALEDPNFHLWHLMLHMLLQASLSLAFYTAHPPWQKNKKA